MPTPRAGERRKDFVSRCIPVVLDDGTAESSDQAVAVCNSMWEQSKKERGDMTNQVTINIGTSDVTEAVVVKEEEELETRAVWSTAMVNDLPDSCFLYIEPRADKDGEGKTVPRSLRHFPYKDASGSIDLPHLRNAIARIPQADIPAGTKKTLQARARKLLASATSKEDEGWFESLVERVKSALGVKEEEPTAPDTGLMLWKEADGLYHWVARYSNNFRDEDDPPEIISAASHQHFVSMVDKGEYPLPELWLWHVKDWKWGQADWVAWDDAGFALAGGRVDPGQEALAEHIKMLDPSLVRVSHGMPRHSIRRDEADDSVIVEHLTREISPLPAWAAANQLTGFILSKEVDMAIPDEKLTQLREEWHLSDEILSTLQAANAAEAEEGKQAGIEQKEKTTDQEPAPEPDQAQAEVAEVKAEEPAPEPTPEPEPEPEPGVSRAEMQEALQTIGQAISALSQQVMDLKGQVTQVEEHKSVEEALTLSEIFERAIGHPDARVDGRTSQAKDRPRETKPETEQIVNTGNPLADSIINQIVSGEFMAGLRSDTPPQ